MSFFATLFGYVNSKLEAFFAGPGGAIVKAAAANALKIAGQEASTILLQMAQNAVAGKSTMSGVDWATVSKSLQTQAIQQGIPFTEQMVDWAISNAVQANATNAVPATAPVVSLGERLFALLKWSARPQYE
jgi:hypothetical protein